MRGNSVNSADGVQGIPSRVVWPRRLSSSATRESGQSSTIISSETERQIVITALDMIADDSSGAKGFPQRGVGDAQEAPAAGGVKEDCGAGKSSRFPCPVWLRGPV